jgi:outer membrane murein-binding lipoprotein Lpp
MKNIRRNCIRAVVLGSILATAGMANAQTETTTSSSTTTSAGTISAFSPDVITVRSDSSATPLAYSYTKTTTYVDENGNPVSMDVVRSGAPVTVYYTQDGDRMVATKVIVRKVVTTDPSVAPIVEQKKTTTTTTTSAPSGQ